MEFESIRIFAKQQGYRNAVIFNNGLHGWHIDDNHQYPYYYEETINFLLDEFKDTPIAIVLTTSVADAWSRANVDEIDNANVGIDREFFERKL